MSFLYVDLYVTPTLNPLLTEAKLPSMAIGSGFLSYCISLLLSLALCPPPSPSRESPGLGQPPCFFVQLMSSHPLDPRLSICSLGKLCLTPLVRAYLL